jgi:hypothetical protein
METRYPAKKYKNIKVKISIFEINIHLGTLNTSLISLIRTLLDLFIRMQVKITTTNIYAVNSRYCNEPMAIISRLKNT